MDYLILNPEDVKEKHSYNISKTSPYDAGIPLLETSDKTIEEIYYFRWHTFCKHIKQVPEGYVITEFYPDVPWAGVYNTISCPAGHHIYEGRWLHDRKYLNSYMRFWFTEKAEPRKYSFWAADAIFSACEVYKDFSVAEELYQSLKNNFFEWEKEKGTEDGMFFQIDDRDGMEYSIGGSGKRPTINSYMYGDALALSKIAKRLNKADDQQFFKEKAESLKSKTNAMLWDNEAKFFKTVDENGKMADVRELVGYVPWYFNLPDEDKCCAWSFLNDDNYFKAPFGPTSAEQNHPDFMKEHHHECLWNGPSWPFATSQTLTALNNLLCNYKQNVMTKHDYYALLHKFAASHYIEEDGERRPFIDENLDPFSGEWIARRILRQWFEDGFQRVRGEDYNHSTFCDLVLSGLVGVKVTENALVVNPLFEESDLDYLCADGIICGGRNICVIWDKDGEKYNFGKGLSVFIDGERAFSSPQIRRFDFNISEVK